MVKKTTSAVAVLAASSLTAVALAATTFGDVPADHWANEAIMWANDSGIMTGPGEMPGQFDPAGSVNRAQLAVVSQRLYKQIMVDVDVKLAAPVVEAPVAEWTETTDGVWMDKEGVSYKMLDGKLVSMDTAVAGSAWAEVAGGQWMGADGNWYKFGADSALMMSTDTGVTWTAAETWPGTDVEYKMDAAGVVWSMPTASATETPAAEVPAAQ